jgi:hypothetical protein
MGQGLLGFEILRKLCLNVCFQGGSLNPTKHTVTEFASVYNNNEILPAIARILQACSYLRDFAPAVLSQNTFFQDAT